MSNTSNIKQLETELHHFKGQERRAAEYQTEKDRLQKDYELSQKRFTTIFEKSAIGKMIINNRLDIVNINPAALAMLGYKEHEMMGGIMKFVHPDHVDRWKQLQHDLWSAGVTSSHFDACLIRKDGSNFWAHITGIQIEDDGKVLAYTTLEDISERKNLERLHNLLLEQEQHQQIAETILNTQEAERRRMAESLHNGLGQLLYGAKLSLNQLELNAEDTHNRDVIAYTQKLLSDCIRECRGIAHNLMPATLQQYGLKEAVINICQQLTERTHFKCDVGKLTNSFDDILEVAIYRMVQELMMNIVKHANASEALVSLSENDSHLVIKVEDNGDGLNQKRVNKDGIGMQTIRYKVTLLGGKLHVASKKGKGTKVRIELPKK